MTTHETKSKQRGWAQAVGLISIIVAIAGGLIYWKFQQTQVYIETSYLDAPIVSLAPASGGILQDVFVHEGDVVAAQTPVAQVGTVLIKTKTAGVIVSVPNTVGAQVSPSTAVVSLIDPMQLRVVGKIDEDKGLDRISLGDRAQFTVDAFGSKKFTGFVDEVSPMSQQSGVVFNISDKRETKQFLVKVRFDTTTYPELKNGMSARMWVYTE